MKTVIYIFFCVLICVPAFGQQLPQFTQFQTNQYLINPAATGAEDFMNVSLGGRLQWTGFEDAPKTSFVYLSTPAEKFRSAMMKRTYGKVRRGNKSVKHPKMRVTSIVQAFGGQLAIDQFGAFRSLKFAGSYAVHLPLSRDYKLSFGTNAGLSSRTFLADKAQVLTSITGAGNDALYNAQISGGNQNIMDIDAGLYFYGKGLYVGFSGMQLTRDLVKFGNLNANFSPVMHFYGSAGYRFEVNSRLDISPGFFVRYVPNAPATLEANVLFDFNKTYWIGTSYRHLDAVAVLAGINISEKFRIGYSFDLSISRLIKYNSGGHELVLSFLFGKSNRSFSRI